MPIVCAEESDELIQEVFKSDMVFPQEKGEVQLTFSPEYSESNEGSTWALPITIEYGLTDNLQFEIEWVSYAHINPDDEGAKSGTGDAEIGLQYSWLNIADSSVHAAFGIEMGIPLGDDKKDLGEGEKSYGAYFILANDVTDQVHVFLQAGVEHTEHEEGERFVNVGLVTAVTENASLTVEYNWEEDAQYVTPGFVWSAMDDWELGLGVPIGLGDEADDFQFILHVIFETDT